MPAVVPYSVESSNGHFSVRLWATGLLVSLGVHVIVLTVGLPELQLTPIPDQRKVVKTEIFLDVGGPQFEVANSIEAAALSAVAPDEAILADVRSEAGVSPQPQEANIANPQVLVEASHLPESVVTAPVQALAEGPMPEAITPTNQEAPPSAAAPAALEPVKAIEQEPGQVPELEQLTPAPVAPSAETLASLNTTVAAIVPEDFAAVSTFVPVASPLQDNAGPETSLVIEPLPGVEIPEIATTTADEPMNGVLVPEVSPDDGLLPLSPSVPLQLTVDAVLPANVTSITPPEVPPSAAVNTSAAVTLPDAVPPPVLPEAIKPDPVAVEQKVAAVESLSGADVLEPADLIQEPAAVPESTVARPGSVEPSDVDVLDPTERIESYVAAFDVGDCAHVTVESAGVNTAQITAFGAAIEPFVTLDKKFKQDQGFAADIELRVVTQPQCALLNTLSVSDGIEAVNLISLDKTVVRSGTAVSGVVGRDLPTDKILVAQQSGVPLFGNGPPELYLIDDIGQIHDGRSFVLPYSDPSRAGGWRFAIPVTKLSSGNEETALVLVVWNRPVNNQPSRFGTYPASRITSVLEYPGVYSLTAFKVTR